APAPLLSPEAACRECSCRIQVMIGRFGSRRVGTCPNLTCRIVSFDSLCAAVMLASAVVGFSEAASAAGGCGPGWYRGAYGGCRPMRGAVVVRPGPVVVAPPVVVVPRA